MYLCTTDLKHRCCIGTLIQILERGAFFAKLAEMLQIFYKKVEKPRK